MKNRPLIGILVTKRRNRKRIIKLYQRHLHSKMRLYAFTSRDIQWKKKRIIGLSLNKTACKQHSFPFPEVLYNQSFNKRVLSIHPLVMAVGRNKCFNTINFFNKWDLYRLLHQSDLKDYLPETLLYNVRNVVELFKKYNLIYIKPSYGSKGESVYRLEQMDNGDIHISLHSLAPSYICRKNEDIQKKLMKILKPENYIVQQGVRSAQLNQQYFDIRVLVQKGVHGEWTIPTIVCRVACEQYFNTSVSETIYDFTELLPRLLAPEQSKDILQSLYEISVKTAKAIEIQMGLLGELSVDFMLDGQKKLWIIEINGKPQKKIYKALQSSKFKKLIYARPMEYAYYLSQLKS